MTTKKGQKQTTTIPFHIAGIRWYWWILILFLIMMVYSGICTVFGLGSGDSLINKLSRGILGFAGGLLNMVGDVWYIRLGIGLWAVFFIAQNASPIVLAWKAHYGKDKTFEEQNAELGIDPEGLEQTRLENAENLAGLTEEKQVEFLEPIVNEKVTDRYLEQVYTEYQTRLESATNEIEQSIIIDEYEKRTEDIVEKAKESGIEEPSEPRPLIIE